MEDPVCGARWAKGLDKLGLDAASRIVADGLLIGTLSFLSAVVCCSTGGSGMLNEVLLKGSGCSIPISRCRSFGV